MPQTRKFGPEDINTASPYPVSAGLTIAISVYAELLMFDVLMDDDTTYNLWALPYPDPDRKNVVEGRYITFNFEADGYIAAKTAASGRAEIDFHEYHEDNDTLIMRLILTPDGDYELIEY